MTVKTRIIDELGESSLLLPDLVERALAANDRVKYFLTLLQTARLSAADQGSEAPDLRVEREACGVEDSSLDAVVSASRVAECGGISMPRARQVHGQVLGCMRDMIAPISVADRLGVGKPGEAAGMESRLEEITAALPALDEDVVPDEYVEAVTRARRGRGDSLHVLVMDLHARLNEMQADLAERTLDGARVHGLEGDDESRVRAFMKGLNRTAALKFDHPGLATTAARSRGRLAIQNDIGTTDAHVLVVHVEGLEVVLTYTDVHAPRAQFFQSLFEPFGVEWEDTRWRRTAVSSEAEAYYLCVGRFRAGRAEELDQYLEFLGSRIVFLIDWNKARKRLRRFLRNRDAVDVLRWAADNEHGHRAFLELGGERLLLDALDHVAHAPATLGQRLDEILGRGPAIELMEAVLRTTAQGLLRGRSARLIRDEIRAELLTLVQSSGTELLGLAASHATFVVELATEVRDALAEAETGGDEAVLERTLRRARAWEQAADEVVVRTREASARASDGDFTWRVVSRADDAADALEDAAFLLTLLPGLAPWGALAPPLRRLADLVVRGAREFLKGVETAVDIERGRLREDVQDFLESVDAVVGVEHETDTVEREVTALLLTDARDFRQLHLLTQLAARLEEAADAMSRCALRLSDHVLADVITP